MNLFVTDRPAAWPDRLPPANRGGPVRVLFLSSDSLGWRTGRQQWATATARRDDVVAVHAFLNRPLWMKLLNRRAFGRAHGVNPATTWRWVIARWLAGPLAGRFDVVHAVPQSVGLAAVDAKRHDGFVLSASCDTTEIQYRREVDPAAEDPPGGGGDAAFFDAADLLLPLSTWAADSLRQDYGVDDSRLCVTPPVVFASATPAKDAGVDRPRRVAFVGNDFVRKGGERLLAWHQGRWAARGVELHVAGADAAGRPPLPGVTWHGRLAQRDVLALLAQCDLLVHPTTRDMSAVVVAEAAAVGTPAVASRLAGIPDLIDDGRSGILVDPADDAGFVAAAEAVLFDADRLATMSAAAKRFADTTLAPDAVYGRAIDRMVALAAARGG